MEKNRLRIWLASGFIVACLFAQPVELRAQCMAGPPMSMTPGMGLMSVTIMLSPSPMGVCSLMTASFAFCFPSGMMIGPPLPPTLLGSAATPVMPGMTPVCGWVCTCPPGPPMPFTISTAAGLPVELMEFSIDGEETEDEDEDEEDEDEDEEDEDKGESADGDGETRPETAARR